MLNWLAGGDQRSDGVSDQVAAVVLENPESCAELFDGLESSDAALRGRVADALEKIARTRPDLFLEHLPRLVRAAEEDSAAKVRFHLAMLLGHLACYPEHVDEIGASLLEALRDESAFVKSWAIASLAIVGRVYPARSAPIVAAIAGLQNDSSIAVRTRARKALALLTNARLSFPEGWVKSEILKGKLKD